MADYTGIDTGGLPRVSARVMGESDTESKLPGWELFFTVLLCFGSGAFWVWVQMTYPTAPCLLRDGILFFAVACFLAIAWILIRHFYGEIKVPITLRQGLVCIFVLVVIGIEGYRYVLPHPDATTATEEPHIKGNQHRYECAELFPEIPLSVQDDIKGSLYQGTPERPMKAEIYFKGRRCAREYAYKLSALLSGDPPSWIPALYPVDADHPCPEFGALSIRWRGAGGHKLHDILTNRMIATPHNEDFQLPVNITARLWVCDQE